MTTFKTFNIAMIACGAIGLTIAPAAFATTADTVNVEIDTRYLETDWGVEMIYEKLVKKSESACTSAGTRGLQDKKAELNCTTTLLDSFIKNAANETLSDYHIKMSD